ncbi:MAG: DEAD/DEAH box helicase, partial [Armatimonadota bacterium]
MDFSALIEEIRGSRDYRGQIVDVRVLPARKPRYGDLTAPLSDRLRSILDDLGIRRLYSHQATAIDLALRGENVVVVASTAGGKTLCYTIPVAEAIYNRPTSRAFLIFPTKALAQDQLRKLGDFGAGRAFSADCYDGDTPPAKRRRVRREAQVILTNPDMLHVGILPYHQNWSDVLHNLRYVILDELHVYRGVFGSHTANVIRRLRRICAHYGADPTFICCSATIANPDELAERLTGVSATTIDNDGSPRGRRYFV